MRSDPPLEPSPGEAEELLRAELEGGAYRPGSFLSDFLDWIGELFQGTGERAETATQFQAVVAYALGAALIVLVIVLLSRLRRTRAVKERGRRSLFGEEVATAAELRRRAEQALAEGRAEDAVVDGYRALALRQIEDDQIDDLPGATANEVAGMLAEAFTEQAAALRRVAGLFDAVLYGRHRTDVDQARSVLTLDDALPGRVHR